MLLELALLVVSAALQGRAQPQVPLDGIRAKILAAPNDSSVIVPLILEASELLPKMNGDEGQQLADAIEPFLRQVYFGAYFTHEERRFPGEEQLGIVEHVVKKGELPGEIAKRYHVGSGLLAMMNFPYDERKIGEGRRLRVLDLSNGSMQVIVDKERFRLSAWHSAPGERFVLSMYVGVGLGAKDTPTPSGTTRIVDRVRDPAWTDPVTRQVFRPGDPGNVLGGFWMKLDAEPIGTTGIGFHGYTGAPSPDWIGKGTSNGCIRLLQQDVERLFELAVEGTTVKLTP
jgi:lipoprotein-anchoring transpeptidase ErfK/SrfK